MKCPKCKNLSLIHKVSDNVDFHYCQSCKGILLTKEYLNDFIDTAAGALNAPKESKYGECTCSSCRKPMKEFYYPQTFVTIDLCISCKSMWLDPGELQEIEMVRKHLQEKGRLETYVPEGTFKAKMLNFVNSTIKALSSFS
jgi:Zn-finger nucleic acid-binding protein